MLAGSDAGTLALIDVREPREFAVDHLAGARNIPVGEMSRRVAEIPRGMTPVFICRSGSRSLTACAVALNSGFAAPAHLEGGLLAWARQAQRDNSHFEVADLA
jgi:adenylyltransferase/sulfurtransferase